MVAEGFRFELEAFNGPLDLLLELIRRAEVDIVEFNRGAIQTGQVSHW